MSVANNINVLCWEQHLVSAPAFLGHFSSDKSHQHRGCRFTQSHTHLLKAQRWILRQRWRINHIHINTIPLSSLNAACRVVCCLFTLETCSVLLLSQLSPVQVSSTLQTIHSGSQEDHNAARHQFRGHPTLQGKNKKMWIHTVCLLSV